MLVPTDSSRSGHLFFSGGNEGFLTNTKYSKGGPLQDSPLIRECPMTTKEMARQTNPPRLAHWKMSLVFVTLVAIGLPTVLHGAVRDIIDFEAFEDIIRGIF